MKIRGMGEGVAAPLEPGTEKFLLDYCKSTSMTLNFSEIVEVMNLWAAAVSKNLQEEMRETKATLLRWENAWMQDETIGRTKGKPDGTLRPSLAKTIERADRAESRIAELETEIAALRETNG